jgi:Gram-negative bacterial TonB protein C-terminal
MTSIALVHKLHEVDGPPLLELRIGSRVVYVKPSPLQRIRLQWTFRHFRTLPAQLLNPLDRRLIAKLGRSAVVTPMGRVRQDRIIGVVETAGKKKVVEPPGIGWTAMGDLYSRWGRLGLATATIAGVAVLLTSQSVRPPQPLNTIAVAQAAVEEQPLEAQPVTVTLPMAALAYSPTITAPVLRPVQTAAAKAPAIAVAEAKVATTAVDPAPVASAVPAAERRWITALPLGRMARPVVPQGSPTGEVELKALIAPDGSVQAVTVLSGDRELAEAGARAVRTWRYSSYATAGSPAAEEAGIRMNFFGPDAISIGTIATPR